jgi:predicted component of type VI protein secretion system
MPSCLTLTLPPRFGSSEVEVDSKRFSIGRTPENDLVIDDTTLSRRHVLIENFDGVFNLSDCGSSNGTLINGRPVTGPVKLRDWDVLTFGGVSDIVVRIHDETQPTQVAIQTPALIAPSMNNPGAVSYRSVAHRPGAAAASNRFSFSGPVIAAAAAVVILLVAGLVLLANKDSSTNRISKVPLNRRQPVSENDNDNDNSNRASLPTPSQAPPESNSNDSPDPGNMPGPAEFSPIEGYASRVLSSISAREPHPVLTESPLREINAQVQRYHGSPTLREELQAMKRALPQVSAIAKSNGVRTPLAVYATLARIDKGGGRGDPVQVAGQITAALSRTRAQFGDELANDSLLWVASLEEGPGLEVKIHNLSGRVNDSVTAIRSIWYLRDQHVIRSETYDFVLRFIAIGVISQDPQKFGIAADPLTF